MASEAMDAKSVSAVVHSKHFVFIVLIITVAARTQEWLTLVHLLEVKLKFECVLEVVRISPKGLLSLLHLPAVPQKQGK